jgi:hypothetical protein
VALFEATGSGAMTETGTGQPCSVEFLNAVPQHRSIRFDANVPSHLDAKVRMNADEVLVERRVVDLACSQDAARPAMLTERASSLTPLSTRPTGSAWPPSNGRPKLCRPNSLPNSGPPHATLSSRSKAMGRTVLAFR